MTGEERPFDVNQVSASRVGKYAECGYSFKLKYVDKHPEGPKGSAALFGTVVHKAREDWILDRSKAMLPLMEAAWKTCTTDDPTIAAFIQAYTPLSRKAQATIDEIKERRPELVAVRRSKDWQESEAKLAIDALIEEWLPKLNTSKYEFSASDPLPALYDESLGLARRYQKQHRHQPNALYTEFAFDVQFEGFTLRGHIDEIGVKLSEHGELQGYTIEDGKTYRQAGNPRRDKRQLVMYVLAVKDLIARGVLELDPTLPLFPVVDLMRIGDKIIYEPFVQADFDEFRDELEMYRRGVSAGVYLRAEKSCSSPWCACAAYDAEMAAKRAA